MSLEERINEEIEDLRANPHVATLSKTNNKRYEIIYSPKEIQFDTGFTAVLDCSVSADRD